MALSPSGTRSVARVAGAAGACKGMPHHPPSPRSHARGLGHSALRARSAVRHSAARERRAPALASLISKIASPISEIAPLIGERRAPGPCPASHPRDCNLISPHLISFGAVAAFGGGVWRTAPHPTADEPLAQGASTSATSPSPTARAPPRG
eukprot:CAMPEP_0119362876 /NCGR_PEP_ID=MMETSP1334-20130426/9786_1 /TAXON_ID=127549 /ORGANISM="Calcidiscus leptoporus, Strain RCC1130" /LENGTH=151 /DNA_ID=CAMNT_0007378143 /DNA_START=240 /DNA_END=693 /DNA_ORIENTATION=+